MPRRNRLLIAFLLGLAALQLSAQDFYSPGVRADFAWETYQAGHYNTALTESEQLIASGTENDTLHYLAARSLLQFDRQQEALEHFRQIKPESGAFHMMGLAAEGLTAFRLGQTGKTNLFADSLLQSSGRYRDYGSLLRCAIVLQDMDTAEYRKLKTDLAPMDIYVRNAINGMDKQVKLLDQKKFKSPARAGLMSALIPGAGKCYLGRWGPGLVSLAGHAVLGVQAWEGYREGGVKSAQFITFGSLLLLSYSANIYGSVMQTKSYNVQIVTDFRQGVALQVDVAFDRLFHD